MAVGGTRGLGLEWGSKVLKAEICANAVFFACQIHDYIPPSGVQQKNSSDKIHGRDLPK